MHQTLVYGRAHKFLTEGLKRIDSSCPLLIECAKQDTFAHIYAHTMRKKLKNKIESKISGTIPSRKSAPMKRLYTVPELVGLTGITRKQVAYWEQINLLNPRMREPNARAGSPSAFYAPEEVVKALVICDLKRAGFSLRQIQQVVHNLEEYGIRMDGSENYLLTDGYSVYYANSDNEAIDILKHHRQRLLLVPVHEQVEKLKKAA